MWSSYKIRTRTFQVLYCVKLNDNILYTVKIVIDTSQTIIIEQQNKLLHKNEFRLNLCTGGPPLGTVTKFIVLFNIFPIHFTLEYNKTAYNIVDNKSNETIQ